MSNHQKSGDIAVVIPTHNRIIELLECLESVYRQKNVKLQVFVINDGSQDGTTESVRKAYPQTQIIEGDGNLWWTGATNVGITAAREQDFKYILLLNDDNILADGALKTLLNYAQNHPDTIVGSLVLIKGTNTIGYAGAGINWFKGGPFLKDYRHEYKGQYQNMIDADFLGGQGVMIASSIFSKIGMFDSTSFPHYHGDADFYLRASAGGIKIVVHPQSIVLDSENPNSFPRYGFRKGFKKLVEAYISRRSPANIVETTRFFWRHCPLWLLPIALPRKFLGFLKGYLHAQFS
ncbi:MAG: glycosyltransferase family 2 protein [Aulosira sp. DedQUE10]|nr:glycosyltransferase family 2 protein [Aulosira sp. DedQUE10]